VAAATRRAARCTRRRVGILVSSGSSRGSSGGSCPAPVQHQLPRVHLLLLLQRRLVQAGRQQRDARRRGVRAVDEAAAVGDRAHHRRPLRAVLRVRARHVELAPEEDARRVRGRVQLAFRARAAAALVVRRVLLRLALPVQRGRVVRPVVLGLLGPRLPRAGRHGGRAQFKKADAANGRTPASATAANRRPRRITRRLRDSRRSSSSSSPPTCSTAATRVLERNAAARVDW